MIPQGISFPPQAATMALIRSLSSYRSLIESLAEFRVVSPPLTDELIRRIGFEGSPGVGDAIVPAAIGPSTHFNALGREVVRKDLPMETRSRIIDTTWKDWHGQTHHGTQYRDYKAYPRELVPPPGEELTVMQRGLDLVAASRVVRRNEPEKAIVHILNLILEIFGQLDIAQPDLAPAVRVRRVNWKILPPGEYPFARASTALAGYLQRLPGGVRAVAEYRIKEITRHKPDFIAVGMGGFSDYVVFGFTDRRRYVLESPLLGNATYVFRDDWARFAALSKAEIIQGNLQEARLIHNKQWPRMLRAAVQRP